MSDPTAKMRRVSLHQAIGFATVQEGATKGAQVGVNLFDADGNLITSLTQTVNQTITHVSRPVVAASWGSITGTLADQLDLKAQQDAQDTALATEATTRANADTALATAISTEATTRGNADTALTTAIATEATTRGNADTTEAAARVSGDAASVATAATDATTKANAAQAFAIQRANHTGSQALSTLSQSGAATSDVATWNGSAWVPSAPSGGGGGLSIGLASQLSNIPFFL